MLVGYLVITFKFPKAEVSKCNLFQQTMPAFLNLMTEQINTFVITRASEIHRFGEQHVLIYEFLVFFRTVI